MIHSICEQNSVPDRKVGRCRRKTNRNPPFRSNNCQHTRFERKTQGNRTVSVTLAATFYAPFTIARKKTIKPFFFYL
jgi:hypothetical protein